MRRVRLGYLVAFAVAGCGNHVTVSASSSSSTTTASSTTATTGAGAGGSAPALPACVSRLSGAEIRPSFVAKFTTENPVADRVGIGSIDVDGHGNVAFSGSPWTPNASKIFLNGQPVATCPAIAYQCSFVGKLTADGNLAWVYGFDSGGATPVVRFRGDAIELVGAGVGLSAPFPPTSANTMDPYFARLDAAGNVTAFVPFSSTGPAYPVFLSQRPMASGGTLAAGYFINGDSGVPAGTFSGCGVNMTVDHPASFIVELDPNGSCAHLDVIGSESIIRDMGISDTGDVVALTGVYSGDLTLGTSTVTAPSGLYAGFLAIGQLAANGESWSNLTSYTADAGPKWQAVQTLAVSRDGTTAAGETMGPNGSESLLFDTRGAFSTTFGSGAPGDYDSVSVGTPPSGNAADRPILFVDTQQGGLVSLGAGVSVPSSPFVALFDGAGNICTAHSLDGAIEQLVVEPSSYVGIGSDPVNTNAATIRRVQFSDLAN